MKNCRWPVSITAKRGLGRWGWTHVVALGLLLLVELRVVLVDAGPVVGRVAAEGDVQVLQEAVAAGEQGLGLVGVGVDAGLAVEDDDPVGEVGGHDEVVLDDEGRLLGVHDEALDDARGDDTLLGVEVGRGLVDQVDVGGHAEGEHDGDALQLTTGQVLDLLVDEVVEVQGLDHVRLELGRQEHGPDLLEEELAHGALELGRDGLRLHADGHLRHAGLAVRLQGAREHATEGGLSGTVLAHHDDDLRVSEATGVDAELEVAEGLLHGGVGERARLVRKQVIVVSGDTEGEGLVAESQVLGRNVTVEEDVDTLANRVREGDNTIDGRPSVEHTDVIREVVEDRQIVLDDNDVVVGLRERMMRAALSLCLTSR